MAKAKALSTFRMGQTLVRTGMVFEAEPDYIRALARNGLAELYAEPSVEEDLDMDEPDAFEALEDSMPEQVRQNSTGRKNKK